MTQPIFLSWTAAKRYERCPTLQWFHKTKQVKKEPDEKPYFKGRVVHSAAEVFIRRRGLGVTLPELIPLAWQTEEAEVVAAGTVIWSAEERAATYASAIELATTLEAMLRSTGILGVADLHVEPKFRAHLSYAQAMYANPDILATQGTVGWLGEIKSGKSYDRGQPDWYVAVIASQPEYRHIETWVALPLLPAVSPTVKPIAVDPGDQQAQVQRANEIMTAMHADRWEAKPGFYCSTCEARTMCPSYQATYGHIQKGRTGLAPI